jgi:uncharacterized protein (TIGR03435 family)
MRWVLMAGVLACVSTLVLSAQTSPQSFDVAVVKPDHSGIFAVFPERSGGRLSWTTDLTSLISYAYDLPIWRISGQIPGSQYSYQLIGSTSADATTAQIREMLQTLLAERFQMQSHRVTKEQEGYALMLAGSGVKLKAAKDGDPAPAMPEWFAKFTPVGAAGMEGKIVATAEGPGVGAITRRRVTMGQLAGSLENVLRTFVTDNTRLPGKYYIGFKYAQNAAPDNTDLPQLLPALQESVGLKLEKRKGPVEMLVVDHLDKAPAEN